MAVFDELESFPGEFAGASLKHPISMLEVRSRQPRFRSPAEFAGASLKPYPGR